VLEHCREGRRTFVAGASETDQGKHVREGLGRSAAQQCARADVPMHQVIHVHCPQVCCDLSDGLQNNTYVQCLLGRQQSWL